MSEAPSSAIDAALARLAALELAWVEHVHAQAVATTDKDEINAIGRTFNRAGRSLRQTLWLQTRRERQQAEDARRAARDAPPRPVAGIHHPEVGDRAQDLFEAVGRIACAMYSHAPEGQDPERDTVLAEHERLVNLEAERSDFLLLDLDAHIADHCARLDLPVELVARWQDLPVAPWSDPGDADYVPGSANLDDPATAAPAPLTEDQILEIVKRAPRPWRRDTS